jgi:hypothetical protein
MTSQNTATKSILACVVMSCVVSLACREPESERSLVGFYQLRHASGVIDLELLPEGKFIETIRPCAGAVSIRRGTWSPPSRSANQIGLEGLWIPQEFVPDYLLDADVASRDGVKFSEPGYWVLRPNYEFGALIIPLFPDAGVRFVRKSAKSTDTACFGGLSR